MVLGGTAAEELVLGTAIKESGLIHLKQIGGGPACGLWQIEPFTGRDIIERYYYRDFRLRAVSRMLNRVLNQANPVILEERLIRELTSNLVLGCIVCRLKYRDAKPKLPNAGDLEAQSHYWKDHYNTAAGDGKPEEYVSAWKRIMG